MKTVKDYLKKYEQPVMSNYNDKLVVYQHVGDMFIEINQELKGEVSRIPDISHNLEAFGRLIKETNNRWNAIDRKWKKRHGGDSPLKHDAVSIYWSHALPQVAPYLL